MKGPPDQTSHQAANGERRGAERTPDDANWEAKVIGRMNGRLHNLPPAADQEVGWESSVLDVLRKRIEKESK